jgi:branched-chain amino acid transport system permease protein
MEYILHIVILLSVYAILAISLDLLAGQTGLLSMAQAGFCGLGAYTSALVTVQAGFSFGAGICLGMLVAAVASLAVSLPSARLHGDYFVIGTFAFQMILYSIFNNWVELTRGPLGIRGIPEPIIFGARIQSHGEFLIVSVAFVLLAYVLAERLCSSPFGRVLRAIREDEVFARALGKNTLRSKIAAVGSSAGMAAAAGSLYAHYISFIAPSNFSVLESILILSMVIIGGAGKVSGALLGAVVLVSLPEVLRFVGLPAPVAANVRQIIYGLLLMVMMVIRPRGLLGRYEFGR